MPNVKRPNNRVSGLETSDCLGKDETPGSNPGLGFLSLLRPVVIGFFVGEPMYTTQERVPGVITGTPTPSRVFKEKTGILHYILKDCHAKDLVSRQRLQK